MLSIYDQGRPPPCPAPFNLAAHVLRHAAVRAEHPALVIAGQASDTVWTYREVNDAVLGIATGFRTAGFKPGDILLMRLGNSVDFPLVFLAAIAAGLVPVPTSAQLTQLDVARIVSELRPAGILRDPEIASVPHAREISLDHIRSMRAAPPWTFELGDPERLAYIVYTSGTGGTPRAVGHAHRAVWARQMMVRDWYDLGPDDRLMHAGAFNWTFTLGTGIMDPLSEGATAIVPQSGTDIATLPDLMRRTDATIFAAVPGVYRKILKSDTLPDLPVLRHGLTAGEKLSPEINEHWHRKVGTPIYEAFGMSECSTFISGSPHRPAETGAIGAPQSGRRIAILGETGPVPINTVGTIAVHKDDPGLMLGYIDAEEETRARFQGDWFLTGDLGTMSASGQICYAGRNDDMMNAGGFRLSPLEVEHAFANCDGVTQFAAAQVEIKPGAFILVGFFNGRADVTEKDLRRFAEHTLAAYKQPKAYVRLANFPTNANGKLLRRSLPDLFED